MNKTYHAKAGEVQQSWLLFDAENVVLGRMAARIATVLQESAKAIRVRLKETKKEAWIPKSVIADDSEVKEDPDRGDLKVLKNFAEREGLLKDSPPPGRSAGEEVHGPRWGDGGV